MNAEQKYIANLAIDRWCKDSTARQIVRYVMECELWGQDTINPTNSYLADKYGWTMNTIESAIKLAKKSQFITTTGARKTRRFELNVGFLKGKMAEVVAQKPLKNTSFDDVLPPYLPPQLPPLVPPQLPPVEPPLANSEYGLPTTRKDQNEGDNNKSMNKNKNTSALEDEARIVEVPISEESSGDSKSPRISGDKKKAYDELIAWSENERGFYFPKTAKTKQYRAFKLANENGFAREMLIDRWEEMSTKKFWQDNGFDWMNVVQDLIKKPV